MSVASLIRAITSAYRVLKRGEAPSAAVVIWPIEHGVYRVSLLDSDDAGPFEGDSLEEALVALVRHLLAETQEIADVRGALEDLVAEADRG